MESEVRTNIVLVNPEEANQPPTAEPESIDQEVYSRKLAGDAIQFLEEEFKNETTNDFWEIIRDAAIKRLGLGQAEPDSPLVVMMEDEIKKFANETMPWGKYLGQKVGTVLNKDRSGLEKFAKQPLTFQIRMRKFLASPLDTVLKTTKKKPKK